MHLRTIHRLAGLSAIVAAGLVLYAGNPSSGDSGKDDGKHEMSSRFRTEDPGARAGKPDVARHRRLAERLLGMTGESAMREAARDGESGFHQIVDSFRPDDFAGVLEELARREGSAVADLRLKLLLVWAERNPGLAAAFATEAAAPVEACHVVAETWSKSDPAAAMAWARGLAEGSQRQEGLVGAGNSMVFDDPRQAIQLALEAGTSPASEELLSRAADAWAAKDPASALSWARDLKEAALKQRLLAAVATSWADHDPRAAANLVIDAVEDGSLEENAIVGIIQRFAFQDMPNAREWVAEFPAGRMRERAEMELARIAERTGAKHP